MRRRAVLTSCGAAATWLAGCVTDDGPSGERPPDEDATPRFLPADGMPASPGAETFLETVEAETDGLRRFEGNDGTERVGFRELDDTWNVRYDGSPHAGEERFREEVATLATAFAASRPEGVSLSATALHECTTGTWQVSADRAAAYERGDVDRETFVDRVYGTAEIVNNC